MERQLKLTNFYELLNFVISVHISTRLNKINNKKEAQSMVNSNYQLVDKKLTHGSTHENVCITHHTLWEG